VIKAPPSITKYHVLAMIIGCVTALLVVSAIALLVYLPTTSKYM